jgi:ATP-dependent Lhr-like helicase
VLRGYSVEAPLTPDMSIATALRLKTVQTTAMVLLLTEGWFEPPRTQGAHLSTLVQQILSTVAQLGGASIAQLYAVLCGPDAPFTNVSKSDLVALVRHLGEKELLIQDSSGVLLHGRVGEKFVNHYSFYAAFATDEEFRIVSGGKALGTLPISQLLTAGQRILFAGKTWIVDEVDEAKRTIYVTRTRGGVPPLFNGGFGRIHTRVRQKMRQILEGEELPPFLDETAKRFVVEGRKGYRERRLETVYMLDLGSEVLILTWLGDHANEALACLFTYHGLVACPAGPGVEVRKGLKTTEDVLTALAKIASEPVPELDLLLAKAENLVREKWDWSLPDVLLRRTYASLNLNIDEAKEWALATALQDLQRYILAPPRPHSGATA